ncbi:MAG TPA: YqgE/AlgH family protein [Burkholderiales bacterium]|nr:YqgE/AlgH family protein [Burkholderiales bacterium]
MTAAALLFASLSASAQPRALERPLTLVAAPAMEGLYRETVILAVPSGDEHLGFILNRPTGQRLDGRTLEPVYFGGPMLADVVFALVPGDTEGLGVRFCDGLSLVADAAGIRELLQRRPNHVRFFFGFVGWKPGELAREIDAGYWTVREADAPLVFDDPERLWARQLERARRAAR